LRAPPAQIKGLAAPATLHSCSSALSRNALCVVAGGDGRRRRPGQAPRGLSDRRCQQVPQGQEAFPTLHAAEGGRRLGPSAQVIFSTTHKVI
jgi:hypothetical protein